MTSPTSARAAALRQWARGMYTTEAAAELLIRADLLGPWARHTDDGGVWFDTDAVDEHLGVLSGGERRTLLIAASLAHNSRTVELGEVVAGLDRHHLALVLAAIAHAGGSHQHADLATDPEGRWCNGTGQSLSLVSLGSLHPWPSQTGHARVDEEGDAS